MKILFATVLAFVLSACGGGGGGGTTTTPNGAPQPVIAVGDSMTFQYTSTPTGSTTGSPTAYLFTRYIYATAPDGGFTTQGLYSNGTSWSQFSVNSDFQETSWISGNTSCNNLPQADSPGAVYSVGKTWNLSYTRTCITANSSTTTQVTNKGSVIGSETITTPAGTFDTYKTSYVFTSSTAASTGVESYTCWRDKTLNRYVSCDWTSTSTPTSTATAATSYKYTQRLSSLQVVNYAGSKPSVERFSGNWTLNWTGAAAGKCSVFVSVSGSISGTCEPAAPPFIQSSISGSVNVNGLVSATITSGAAISGTFSAPTSASGTWSNGGLSGSWTAGHL